jgi:hypothetical protein
MPKFYINNAQNRKLNRVGKPCQRGGTLPQNFYPSMIKLFRGDLKLLEPKFPTKEIVLDILSKWQTVNCVPYKNGKVMVMDNIKDTKNVSKCPVFREHKRIQKDLLYQFVLYKTGEERQILLVPAYDSPEVGSKHNCLVNRLPDGAELMASGELLRRENTIFYSCVSSLFFNVIWRSMFPNLHAEFRYKGAGRKEFNNFKYYFESESVKIFLKSTTPQLCNIVYVNSIEDTGSSPVDFEKSRMIDTGAFTRKIIDPEVFCSLPWRDRPSCLRYMHNDTCEIAQNHPKGDCTIGVDFCSNMDRDSLEPFVIPKDRYVYEQKIDTDKATAFLEKHGQKGLPKGAANYMLNRNKARDYAKKLGLSEEEILHELYVLKQIWP